MKRYGIEITRQAKQQINEIGEYISCTLLEPNTAKKIMRLLRTKIESLSEMPHRIKTVDEEPWGSYGVRKLRVKNYYIYFWINEERRQVFILSVIYARRDQVNHLDSIFTEK